MNPIISIIKKIPFTRTGGDVPRSAHQESIMSAESTHQPEQREPIWVKTTIIYPDRSNGSSRIIDINDRTAMHRFAGAARKALLAGGKAISEAVPRDN